MLSLLAATQLVAGETNQAVASFGKLATLRPESPLPLLGLAEAQLAVKAFDAAAATMKKAAAIAPDSLAVAQRAVQVDASAGHLDVALTKARAVEARFPKAADGFVLEGDVHSKLRNWTAASAAYRGALQLQPDASDVAQRLHLVLRSSGAVGKADAFAAEWTRTHPKDSGFLFYLAGLSVGDRYYELGEKQLRQVLAQAPDSTAALNNLAWVLNTAKKPGALEATERANQIAPDQPTFMDTLAMVLADQGQLGRAIEVQRKAVELDPSAGGLRLRLARLQLQSGDKVASHLELYVLTKLGDKFSRHEEVADLLSKLSR